MSTELTGREVAVVGLAGRFPGAADVRAFWRNLCAGVESVRVLTDEELRAAGASEELLRDPRYVRARAVLDGIDRFDAAFFGFAPREAEILDPQHRVFLECAWTALEDAGVDPLTAQGLIAVYAGVGASSYAWNVLARRPDFELLQALFGNDKDYLATQVSYRLNLRGPSLTVQTACSTSLVAIHLACQALINYECDLALAGGVSIGIPQERGYLYQEGSILSPDGHCRAFDARAAGTLPGSGAGIVVLERLEDALAAGRTVHAVVRGSAINNDGSFKVGYTAPSVEGQAEVIAAAQAMAGVDPGSISYIETHGTGTPLGDPIEIAALTQAFRAGTDETGFCALGALKTNVGHLDTAAGVAGFIKTVLALEHRRLPPTLHFERPNPETGLDGSPFFVQAELADWETDRLPRRAGVSSFGIGGTNAHVILEEPPEPEPSGPSRPFQIVALSARTPEALETLAGNLAAYLEEHPEIDLADAAHTLRVGRRAQAVRQVVVRPHPPTPSPIAPPSPGRGGAAFQPPQDRSREDGRGCPLSRLGGERWERGSGGEVPSLAFLLPGQGTQYPGMAADLWRGEPAFREAVDECARLLEPHLGLDLRLLIWPAPGGETAAAERLGRTELTQPALFMVEWALARLWREWGIVPEALLGHSLGEIVAACLAGVFSLQDALAFVALRGRLLQALPPGAMLAVPLSEAEIEPWLEDDLSLAAVNAPAACTVSGPPEAVERLRQRLEEGGIRTRPLHTSHAFHSAMVDPVVGELEQWLRGVELRTPEIPFFSNVTGTWITDQEATDLGYWARHVRSTVRFAAGCAALLADPARVLLEVGPGGTLGELARRQPAASGRVIAASLPAATDGGSDLEKTLNALGRLWVAGARVDWHGFAAHERRRLVPLPTYPFERRRYWADPPGTPAQPEPEAAPIIRPDLRDLPRGEVESTLATLWEEVLGVGPVSRDDDFFELGGSSLLALGLLTRIEQRLGAALPLSALAKGRSTIADLAALLRANQPTEGAIELAAPEPPEGAAARSPGREPRERSRALPEPSERATEDPLPPPPEAGNNGDAPGPGAHAPGYALPPPPGAGSQGDHPLFWLHPIGGSILAYLPLARLLGRHRPVWAFPAPGFDGDRPPLRSIADLATEHLAALRRVRPAGPYLLGGWSFGGLVAWEMRRRLLAEGEEVPLLTLIDTWPPGLDLPGANGVPNADPLAAFARDLTGGAVSLDISQLANLPEDERLARLLDLARRADLLPAGAGPERLRRLWDTFAAHAEAVAAWRPEPSGGRTLLLLAAGEPGGAARCAAIEEAWALLGTGPLESHRFDATHWTLLAEPRVREAAERVESSLSTVPRRT
jgi:phthiocerol/phenolphthiocerol synthesis type-I polyketide synthase E